MTSFIYKAATRLIVLLAGLEALRPLAHDIVARWHMIQAAVNLIGK